MKDFTTKAERRKAIAEWNRRADQWRENPDGVFTLETAGKDKGTMPSKQLKMLLGWAAFHQEELRENWGLAREQQELFAIEPLK